MGLLLMHFATAYWDRCQNTTTSIVWNQQTINNLLLLPLSDIGLQPNSFYGFPLDLQAIYLVPRKEVLCKMREQGWSSLLNQGSLTVWSDWGFSMNGTMADTQRAAFKHISETDWMNTKCYCPPMGSRVKPCPDLPSHKKNGFKKKEESDIKQQ